MTCLGENTGKYITFTAPIGKEVTRIDKNGEEVSKNISYILQFIDSARFMASSLSNSVKNLSEEIHQIKFKYGHDNKKCETCRIIYNYCDYLLEKLKERFFNIYKFSNHGNNKFILFLRKYVYPYEYMNNREKFNETTVVELSAT